MVMQKFFFSSNFTGPGPKKIPERFFIKNGSAKFFLTKFHRAWAGKKNFSQTVFYKKIVLQKFFFSPNFTGPGLEKKLFPNGFL